MLQKYVKKGSSQEESDSWNLLLSLINRIEDVIILRFISLVKPLLQNDKTQTQVRKVLSHFCSFWVNYRKDNEKDISLKGEILAAR